MQINRVLTTILLSIAFSISAVVYASEPVAAGFNCTEIEDYSTSEDEYSYSSDDFLLLDSEALEELSAYGFKSLPENDELASDLIDYAKQFLGRPYARGGKGPQAFDCSGFTSYVFKKYGISLSASSRLQSTQGIKIEIDDVRPGDLLFFSGRGGGDTVGHVAMVVDVNEDGVIKFIHAGCSHGISYANYPDGGYYSKHYLHACRVIE